MNHQKQIYVLKVIFMEIYEIKFIKIKTNQSLIR
jgi:hypothetical protein